MNQMLKIFAALIVALAPLQGQTPDKPEARDAVKRVVTAAGGEEKLLRVFRMKERLNVSPDPEKMGNERVSFLEPPKYWWVGKRERVQDEKEPATFLVWGWTLGALLDSKSKVEIIPEITENEKPVLGLRVSETITPAMDFYFDKQDFRLVRIDWRNDIHRFSEWKEHDGATYAARCIGYKKKTGKPWYYTEILEIERLKELPAELRK